MAMMFIAGGLLAALVLGHVLSPAEREEKAMAGSAPPPGFPSSSEAPRGALSPAVVAHCRRTIADAAHDRVIRERPAPNRIDVDERLWSALAPSVRDGLMQALACDAWHTAAPPRGERAVAYGWNSRRRLAVLSGIRRGEASSE